MEKNKVGEFHFVTESYLMDFRGRITIPMIGTYLLHAASCHAADRGFGYNDSFPSGYRDDFLSCYV